MVELASCSREVLHKIINNKQWSYVKFWKFPGGPHEPTLQRNPVKQSFACQGGCYPWHWAPFNVPFYVLWPWKEIILQVDAAKFGFGATLLQDETDGDCIKIANFHWNELCSDWEGNVGNPIGCKLIQEYVTAAVVQWVRAVAPKAAGWVFESQPQQTLVIKTGNDSSTAKHATIGASVTGPRRWPL